MTVSTKSSKSNGSKGKMVNAKKQNQRSRSMKRRLGSGERKPKTQRGAGYHPIDGKITPSQAGGMMIDGNTMLYMGAILMLGIVIYLVWQTREAQREIAIAASANNVNLRVNNAEGVVDINNGTDGRRRDLNKYRYNDGHRVYGPESENYARASYWDYINRKNYERTINPLLPPERSYESTYGIPVNVPTRGYSGGYQQVGYMYKDGVMSESATIGSGSDSVIIPIYGRPTYPGSNKWNYFVSSDKYHSVKIPFVYNGRKSDDDHGIPEIYDGDSVELPAYNGNFQVNMYTYDSPRYIPYVY